MHVFLHAVGSFFAHLAAVDFAALGIACGLQALRLTVRTAAWRNIIAAAYPGRRVRWLSVLGAYLGGVGLNAVVPARGGDALKLYLVKHRVSGSTYPTLAATLVVETLFDALVGIALLLWGARLPARGGGRVGEPKRTRVLGAHRPGLRDRPQPALVRRAGRHLAGA